METKQESCGRLDALVGVQASEAEHAASQGEELATIEQRHLDPARIRVRHNDKVVEVCEHTDPAEPAAPVLQRIARLRFGLVDVCLRLDEREGGGELRLLHFGLVGPDLVRQALERRQPLADSGEIHYPPPPVTPKSTLPAA